MNAPTNFRELVCYLTANRHVRVTGPTPESVSPVTRDETFLFASMGRLWFQPDSGAPPHHMPLDCTITEAAAKHETGLEFDAAGFTLTKFGVSIRVEYLL